VFFALGQARPMHSLNTALPCCLPSAPCQVLLLADGVRCAQPSLKVSVQIPLRRDAHEVPVPPRHVALDPHKTGIVDSPGRSKADEQIRAARLGACESYPRLTDDSRLLWIDSHRPAPSHHPGEFPEQANHVRLAAFKMRFEPVLPARMPHVSGDELLPAHRTSPQRLGFRWHRRPFPRRSSINPRLACQPLTLSSQPRFRKYFPGGNRPARASSLPTVCFTSCAQ
jgi:hypothetical protein